ncbi:MAG: hypothetical protein ACI8YQ_003432 [Polaribacter sp.]|jgi:hypothetical protein
MKQSLPNSSSKKYFMNRILLLFIFFTFLSSSGVEAQFKKGMSSIGLGLSHTDYNYRDRSFGNNWYSMIHYDRMISDKMMIGASLEFEESVVFGYSYSIASLSPSIRFFFTANKFPVYVFLEPSLSYKEYHLESDLEIRDFKVSPVGGLGASYFVAPQVALEAKFGLAFWNGPDRKIDELFFNLGTKVFLYSNEKESDLFAESILQKGNLSFNGVLSFRREYSFEFLHNDRGIVTVNSNHTEFYISPQARYFITNHLELEASFNYYKDKYRDDLGYKVIGAYYIKALPHFYIKPSLGIRKGNEETPFGDFNTLTIPLSISLEYFKKSNQYFAGMTHSRESNKTLPNTYDFFAGVTHFITKELTINGKLNYRQGKEGRYLYNIYTTKNQVLSFSFGLNFWIL